MLAASATIFQSFIVIVDLPASSKLIYQNYKHKEIGIIILH
jgi:hypothetical protein